MRGARNDQNERLEDAMLTLTDAAINVIQNLTFQSDLPDDRAGLRIVARSPEEDHSNGGLALSLAEGPVHGDEVVEAGPARVYMEADAALALRDQQLDAMVSDEGAVKFLIAPQR
jgi:Fe-S cluster assembly iron-binding protein IscA